jgi:uncharacterized membrane protein YphA (DoxX/SURF4 family)
MKKKHHKWKKILTEFCRIILGVVFVFSGFVKAVDPLGSTYKIIEYFSAFGLDLLNFSATPIAFIQAAIEFAVGVCLLLGVRRRFHAILALLIMIFMTPLTFYLAITNPVTDCGCFGDALVLTNWQTFLKNLVLLAAAIILYLYPGKITPFFTKKSYALVMLWIYLFVVGVSVYCYIYLPIFDFRPYKVGANIPELMRIPEDAEHPVYETTLIYSKDKVQKEFTIENYPKDDESWIFIDSETALIKKGYEPPIHDFSISNEEKYDITNEVLSDTSYTFLLIAHNLEKAKDTNVDKINEVYDYSQRQGYEFYALTSSTSQTIQEWIKNTGAEYPFCTMDDVPLKTIIRSNPGLLLLKGGTIVNKWPNSRLPDVSKLNKPLQETGSGVVSKRHNVRSLTLLILILFTPLSVIFVFDFFYYRKKLKKEKEERRILRHANKNRKSNHSYSHHHHHHHHHTDDAQDDPTEKESNT